MSKFLSISGLKTLFSKVKDYVDSRTVVYIAYPAYPIYSYDGTGFNKHSVELRAFDDEEGNVFFPITTIDSILNSDGTKFWEDELNVKLNSIKSQIRSEVLEEIRSEIKNS